MPEGTFAGLANAEAAREAPIVLLCVPFRNQSENLTNLKDVADARVSCSSTPPSRWPPLWAARRRGCSACRRARPPSRPRRWCPTGCGWFRALHTVSAAALADLDAELDEDVLICGDRRDDKREAAELIERIPGLRCVDAGRWRCRASPSR